MQLLTLFTVLSLSYTSTALDCGFIDGNLISMGQTVEQSGYVLTCVEDSPGVSYLAPTKCVHDDRVLNPGDVVETEYYEYTCKQLSTGVVLEITGCKDEKGRTVQEGQSFQRLDTVYDCARRFDGLQMVPTACAYDGAEYRIGTVYDGAEFYYECKAFADGTVYGEMQGCLGPAGQRMTPGSKYHKNDFVVECRKLTNRNGIIHKIVGCVERRADGTGIDRPVGSRWVEGKSPFQYEMTCSTCAFGDVVRRSSDKCVIPLQFLKQSTKQSMELKPGCMRPTGKMLACCGTRNGGLQVFLDAMDREEWYRRQGYVRC